MKLYTALYLFLIATLFPLRAQSVKPVARVNGTVLTDRDLLREMYIIFPYARVHNGFPKPMEADIRSGALKMIVFEELVYQEAERRKMTVPAAKLDRALADFRKQFATEPEFQQYVKTELNGMPTLLREKVKRSLLIDQMLKDEVANKAVVTPAEVKAYYSQHPEKFQIPESYKLQTISVLPPPNATPGQLKEAAKRAASALHEASATKNYTDFGLLAEKISEDDYRVNMGDHHAVDRAQLPPAILQAVLGMKDGQVSGLIQVEQVYTIVRLNGHVEAGIKPFSEVEESLRKQMEKNKTEQLRSMLDRKLRAKAKVEEL